MNKVDKYTISLLTGIIFLVVGVVGMGYTILCAPIQIVPFLYGLGFAGLMSFGAVLIQMRNEWNSDYVKPRKGI